MSKPGLGVMIGMLGGNRASVDAFKNAVGKKIVALSHDDDSLFFTFEDGYKMSLSDEGQSCCESRYMRTDDNLEDFIGTILLDAEIKDGPEVEEKYETHEVQFLEIKTDKGSFTMSNHNEHNGYYGGFLVRAREWK